MASTLVGRTPTLGFHTVNTDGTPPPQPVVPPETPVEEPPPDAAGTPADDDAASGDLPAAPEKEDVPPKPKPPSQRRWVAERLEENRQLRERNARLEAQLDLLARQSHGTPGAGGTPAPAPQPARTTQPPRQQDYDLETPQGADAFSQALQQYWRAMSREEAEALLRSREDQAMQGQIAALHEDVNRIVSVGRRKYDDFDEAVASLNAELQGRDVFGVLKQHIVQSPKGAELLRHVGLHDEVLQELKYRTVEGAAHYLRTLEATLGQTPQTRTSRTSASPSVSASASVLPPAVRPLTGGGGVARPQGSTPSDIANGTQNFREYVRTMRSQEQERRR